MNDDRKAQWERRLKVAWYDLQSACDNCKTDIELIKSLSRTYNDLTESFLKEV